MINRQWFYVADDRQVGPVAQAELLRLLQTGVIPPETLVWAEDLDDWRPASAIPGLQTFPSPLIPPPLQPEVVRSYAGFWKRFAALLIDIVILVVGGALAGGILGGVMGFFMGAAGVDVETITKVAGGVGQVLGYVLNWLYFTLFESSRLQATPGKLVVGIEVVDLNGRRIGFGRANGRYWSKLISGIIFLVGYLMAAFTEQKQALHDIIAGCLVVDK